MNQISSKPNPNTHKCIQAGSLDFGKWDKMHDIGRRYYDPEGIAPTLHTCGGGNIEPKIIERVKCDDETKQG